MRGRALLWTTAVALGAAAPTARAQEGTLLAPPDARILAAAVEPERASPHAMAAGADTARPPLPAPWWSPLASAVIPGSGQAAQRRRRAVAYVALEGMLLAQFLHARRDGSARRREYRELAELARGEFSDRFPVGNFEYYERMEQFLESGVYDADPGEALVPDVDTTTFNGFTWQLARRTFWEDPEAPPPVDSDAYRSAVDFYRRRAVPPAFRWSWRNALLEQDLFRQTIRRSNSAFRRSSDYLTMLIANHVLSAVDAFVVVRLSGAATRGEYRVHAEVPWAPLGRPGPGGSRSP
jgi:hypothetical protein